MKRPSPRDLLAAVGLFALVGCAALHAAPPVASDDRYATDENRPLTVSAPAGLLSNDDRASHIAPAAAVLVRPGHGQLELNPDGSFVYVPAANYHGQDAFTYRVYGDRRPVLFTIDAAASTLNLAVTLRVEFGELPSLSTDADHSRVTGTVALELAPTNAPFAVARVTDLQATLTDALALELGVGCLPFLGCLAGVQVETPTNDLRLATTFAGPVATVSTNGTFDQDGNLLRVTGNLTLQGTGQLADLLPKTTVPLKSETVRFLAFWATMETAKGTPDVLGDSKGSNAK